MMTPTLATVSLPIKISYVDKIWAGDPPNTHEIDGNSSTIGLLESGT
jgi:hypothetical protein